MNIGKRIVSGISAAALAGGFLIGASPAAVAAVGDTTAYDVTQREIPDLEDVVMGPDGLLWVWDDNESEFLRVNMSGEVQGVVPSAGECWDGAFKIAYIGTLWCFDDDEFITRFYADGRRTRVALPAILARQVKERSLTAAIGPDGQLWVVGAVNSATIELATNLPGLGGRDPEVIRQASLFAVPISGDGSYGEPLTLGSVTGNWRDSGWSQYVALSAGPNNSIYYAWTPGYDIYTGDVTNIYGTFTPDGVVSSSSEVVSPDRAGLLAGRAVRNGDQMYVLGQKFRTEQQTRNDANGVPVPITSLVDGRSIFDSVVRNADNGTLSVFASPSAISRSDLAIEVYLRYKESLLVVDAQGYFWSIDDGEVVRLTTSGNVQSRLQMPLGESAYAVAIGSDGNAWVAADDILVRVLTGAVPTNAAAPTLSQVDGVTVGTPISGTTGEWNDPSGTYEYQWQVCSSNDASTCTDIPGATAAQYTPSTSDDGKYVRMATYATSANGRSEPAYSGLVAVGAPAAPPAANPGAAVKATGSTAVIGNAQTMELDVPRKTKRGKKKLYEVFFTATDVPGTVTFTFKRRSKVKTVTVPIEDGIAEYRWKTPRKWPRGKTRVTATYVPSAGSPYTAAAVTDRVKVRGR